jgi:putative addiction module component (TIGR02574 family)
MRLRCVGSRDLDARITARKTHHSCVSRLLSRGASIDEADVGYELRSELLTLSPEERLELADELYESLVDESLDPHCERAWSEEIQKRMADVAADRVELVDADEVHALLRDELRDSHR